MLKMWRICLLSIVMLLAMLWQGGSASASAGRVVVPSVNPAGDDVLTAIPRPLRLLPHLWRTGRSLAR